MNYVRRLPGSVSTSLCGGASVLASRARQEPRPTKLICHQLLLALAVAAANVCSLPVHAQEPLTGSLGVHDPSTMIKEGNRYYIFFTGNDIGSKTSTDRLNWSAGPNVFSSGTRPTWTTNAVPGFTGTFWAP